MSSFHLSETRGREPEATTLVTPAHQSLFCEDNALSVKDAMFTHCGVYTAATNGVQDFNAYLCGCVVCEMDEKKISSRQVKNSMNS